MFKPNRIIFEKEALDYEMGHTIKAYFENQSQIEKIYLTNNRIKQAIPGENPQDFYANGKKTLVVGIKKSLKFQSCKPSAHYQLPLVSGCMGQCEYCYLNTQLGDKPFIKVHVNIEEILEQAQKYKQERLPEITLFEGAATSDPLPVEPYTHALGKAILTFGAEEKTRFRFVSKYTDVDSLLNLEHRGHTEIRFSLNTQKIIATHEHFTASAKARIAAARKVAAAGYPIGFIIAPVFLYEGWQEEYKNLLEAIKEEMPKTLVKPLSFEVITHRYTTRAKNIINDIFPENTLPMTDEERRYKYGQFGYGKYVYKKEEMTDVKTFFEEAIHRIFESVDLKYII